MNLYGVLSDVGTIGSTLVDIPLGSTEYELWKAGGQVDLYGSGITNEEGVINHDLGAGYKEIDIWAGNPAVKLIDDYQHLPGYGAGSLVDADLLDGLTSTDFIKADGSVAMSGNLDLDSNSLTNVGGLVATAHLDIGAYQIRALQFYAGGAADAGGVFFGDTTQIWQSSANVLYTPDSFTVIGFLGVGASPDADRQIHISYGIGQILARFEATGHFNTILELVTDGDGTPREGRVGIDYSDSLLRINYGSGFDGTHNGLTIDSSGNVGASAAVTIAIKATFQATDSFVGTDSVNASDTKSLTLASTDTAARTRGAYISLYGNEYAGAEGAVIIAAGDDVADGAIHFRAVATEIGSLSRAGQLLLPTTGSGAGLLIGGTVHVYALAANVGYTPDAWQVGGLSDYTQIEADGDVNFVGGGGLQFGEIYYHGAGFGTALAAQDTDYQILGFDTDGETNGNVTPAHASDHITVGVEGRYRVTLSVSSRSAASNNYEFHVAKNNNDTTLVNASIHRTTSVANRLGHGATSAIIDCAAADTIEVWVRRTDGGAVEKTITIESITLNVEQIGGT